MNQPEPSNPVPQSTPPQPPPARKRSHWLLWLLGSFFALLLIIAASAALTIWWIQRPIKPVVLSAKEKAAVEEKLRAFGATAPPAISPSAAVDSTGKERTQPARSLEAGKDSTAPTQDGNRTYIPGSKTLKLTERELNGLLNANTDLGETVRIELDTDAINAYLAVPIPKDFPIGGGRTFRMRGRFRVSLGENQAPYAILEDVTVLGLSLPKDWLAGIKGENLLSDAVGKRNGSPIIKGVKSLQIKPGVLVLEVAD